MRSSRIKIQISAGYITLWDRIRLLAFVLFLPAGIQSAAGFALLGPFAPWMVAPLAYQVPHAIGGPMLIGEGYRWNVPVITYGFDQSFLDYFGTNGVAAVESAIQILNDLPPASQIIVTNYPFISSRMNYAAESESLLDLKSTALTLLLEQLGLAQPSPAVFSLRDFSFDPASYFARYAVEIRNYSPFDLAPTVFVNSSEYQGPVVWIADGGNLLQYSDGSSYPWVYPGGLGWLSPGEAVSWGRLVDPIDEVLRPLSVADGEPGPPMFGIFPTSGRYFRELTIDDVAGLAFQFGTNNIAFENLLPDARGAGTNTGNYVGGAMRPGVDKITFQRTDPVLGDPQTFPTVTNQYLDSYITNGTLHQQTLERVITQPDIRFTAHYIGLNNVSRTGTTNWVNNGGPGHDGPGVIRPPIVINFNRFGPSLSFDDAAYPSSSAGQSVLPFWGTFDGTTNPPVIYPVTQNPTNSTEFHFFLNTQYTYPLPPTSYTWNLSGPPDELFALQTSTNLSDWVTIATITNLGGTFTYEDYAYPATPQRFFRTQPQ